MAIVKEATKMLPLTPKPIISLKEARKLLGIKESQKLTNDDLKKLILDYEFLARQAVKEYLVRK